MTVNAPQVLVPARLNLPLSAFGLPPVGILPVALRLSSCLLGPLLLLGFPISPVAPKGLQAWQVGE